MNKDIAYSMLNSLVTHLRLELVIQDPQEFYEGGKSPLYRGDGKIRASNRDKPGELVSNVCHELGHWCIALSLGRDLHINFGLGHDPYSGGIMAPQDLVDIPMVMSEEDATTEEEDASVLGMVIENAVFGQCKGHNPDFTFNHHGWDSIGTGFDGVVAYANALRRLEGRGLIELPYPQIACERLAAAIELTRFHHIQLKEQP